MGAPNLQHQDLLKFLGLIYGTEQGFSYVATKSPVDPEKKIQDTKWSQHFFEWPKEKDQLSEFISNNSPKMEVYYSPALFDSKEATKERVKGARVFWCEFDGSLPGSLNGLPEPHLKLVSSVAGHEHWYWRTESLVLPEDIEDVNRKLAYALGADTSGWDASQVLRPLGTRNHKRGFDVTLKHASDGFVTIDLFGTLPEPLPVQEAPVPDSIPAVEDVVPKYKFTEEIWHLFKYGMPEGKRSDGLMSLGYYFAEMQLPDDEMFAMLLNADERWGKFAGRRDQHKRLMEIVVRSRIKYPLRENNLDEMDFTSYGLRSLIALEQKVEWVWDGFLHTTGYMLVTGPSGVGKTQFSLNAAAKLILGKEHLGRKPLVSNLKVGFFSLEMGTVELKRFLETQSEAYTDEEMDILEQNLRLFPLGEPLYLTRDSEKERIEEIIVREGLNGVIFDSLGSVTEASLSSEENVKNLMDWNDRLRKRLQIFTWYIHHHRKPSGDNKKPNKLGDVYGSQYITARTSTVLALWDIGVKDTIQCIPLKVRFTEKPMPFNMFRDKTLSFYPKVQGITIVPEGESDNEVAKELPEDPVNSPPDKSGNMAGF